MFLRSFLCFSRSFLSSSSSSDSESRRRNEPSSNLLFSSVTSTTRVFDPSASASIISAASAIRVSTSSISTSSTTISLPSSSRTTAFSPFAGASSSLTGSGAGAMSASCAFERIRFGPPRPALRAFSVSSGIERASARASRTRGWNSFLTILLIFVIPAASSVARISFWCSTACLRSTSCCTSLALRSFFNSIFTGFAATFLAGAAFLTGTTFLATAFLAGAAFVATAFFAGVAFFATAFFAGATFFAGVAFLATVFFAVALFLSALNTATIVLWFFRTSLETFYLELLEVIGILYPEENSFSA